MSYKRMKLEDVPEVTKFAVGQDSKVHAFSGFGDAWCDDERDMWRQEPVDRFESVPRPQDTEADDLCDICFADEDSQMAKAEEMWG